MLDIVQVARFIVELNSYRMDDQQDVDDHDYMPEQYDVKRCRNHHEIDVRNADRSCIFVGNRRFADNVDVMQREMLLDRDFLNPLHRNLKRIFSYFDDILEQ